MICIIRLGSSLLVVAAVSFFSCWFGEPAETAISCNHTVKIFHHRGGATVRNAISVTSTPCQLLAWERRILFFDNMDSAACSFLSEDVVLLSVYYWRGAGSPRMQFLMDLSSPRLSDVSIGWGEEHLLDSDTLVVKSVSDGIYNIRVCTASLGDNLQLVRMGILGRKGGGSALGVAGAIDVNPSLHGDTLRVNVIWDKDEPVQTYAFDLFGQQYTWVPYPKFLRASPVGRNP